MNNRAFMARNFFTAIYFFAYCFPLFAQSYKEKEVNDVIVNEANYTVKAQVLSDKREIRLSPELQYHWFNSGKIIITQGGQNGKLLHGKYTCFYLNKNLKEDGGFRLGLKNGKWSSWDETGKIKEIITWKNGKKKGSFKIFDSDGKLIRQGKYKNNELNGWLINYQNGMETEKVKYKNGAIENKQEKKVKKNKEPKQSKQDKKENKTSQQEQPKEKKKFFDFLKFKKKEK